MPISWNEIKSRATAFTKEWEHETSEDAEAKSFWDGFFHVFGISRRRVATFEQQVKKADDKAGFIDLLWKGVILIEHKSRGKDLAKAYQQAKDYFPGLKEKELPRYILVSDFANFRLYDLEENLHYQFALTQLVNNAHHFGFIAGYQKRSYKEQDPVNIEAAELMGKLHDKLKAIGYTGHQLELYLVRLLFCLFADDTSIFEKGIFCDYLELKTNEDGSDLAAHIGQLFQVLNTEENKRFTNLDESLAAFPYVNGKLFEEQLPLAHFDADMRRILLDCCLLDWGKISPAIFGSLFQSVMDEKARRNLGAHYTSEKNILKLIRPLFLDELWQEFEKAKNDKGKLKKLHEKISKLRFLDPACGCGNFLIIAYRELRLLELEIVKAEFKGQLITNLNDYFLVDVDRFYGIEYEEFPSQIAQVAMWLMDHQMNEQASLQFGEYYKRIPLRKSATIVQGNALRMDWQSLIEPMPWEKEEPKFDFILGNPPFGGKHLQSKEQKKDIAELLQDVKNSSDLDYVVGWFYKASEYIQKRGTEVAFVSTNSICQGEQAPLLWSSLVTKFKIKINFAHRTFKWTNEAKGVAAVHCVIIGFSLTDKKEKRLFEYDSLASEPYETVVTRINSYLNAGPIVYITKRQNPICNSQQIKYGNKPTDDGNYIFDDEEKNQFLKSEPKAKRLFKRFIGSYEFINNEIRWCLWLKDVSPVELKSMPLVLERVEKVRKFRQSSTAEPTRKSANFPSIFFYVSHPNTPYLVVPETSSERRKFIPIGYVDKDTIASNAVYLIPNADFFTLGIMCSSMHMSWTREICGRLKSDYRYSGSIVYNNYPWPENPTAKQKEAVEKAAQAVLDARAQFPNSSLADLYDPNTMPPALVKAHNALDKAVDTCYRSQPFPNETKRIEFLFELYDKYTAGLFVKEKKSKKK
jgi:hypothetical protein